MSKKKRTAKAAPVKSEATDTVTKDTSPRVPQRDKLSYTLNIKGLDWTEKQKAFIELATHKDTRVVFLSGPAGTSKTALAVYCALALMNLKKASELIYVRSVVESASTTLGSLPGEAHDKFKPFAMPLIDKLEEFLCSGDIKKLFIDERVKPIPINYLRGASYNANCVIVDEAQNLNNKELVTAITRVGKFSKFFILGDPMQTDLKHSEQSGFKPMFDIFNDEESQKQGIYCVQFGKEDIMRSELLKFIVEKIETYQAQQKVTKH
jgi:phosphate starvation-inducible protein PhoH and related proteins